MASVVARINEIKQPRCGYVKLSEFKKIILEDNKQLYDMKKETIHPTIVGTVVDYLTRFMNGTSKRIAFDISFLGARIANEYDVALNLLSKINGLDDESIKNACRLVTFDVYYRNPAAISRVRKWNEAYISKETVYNIRVMVNRGLNFFKEYGPVTKDGFSFEPNGYTDIVDAGDGDFLTKDTLWDFKVSKAEPTSKHTLQLLMYYLMGQHSGQNIYNSITKIGIFNPRLNVVYILDVKNISSEIIKTVEEDVIGYYYDDSGYDEDGIVGYDHWGNEITEYNISSGRIDIDAVYEDKVPWRPVVFY